MIENTYFINFRLLENAILYKKTIQLIDKYKLIGNIENVANRCFQLDFLICFRIFLNVLFVKYILPIKYPDFKCYCFEN